MTSEVVLVRFPFKTIKTRPWVNSNTVELAVNPYDGGTYYPLPPCGGGVYPESTTEHAEGKGFPDPLPPCGGGLGRGVFAHGKARPKSFCNRDFLPTPLPNPPPQGGRGPENPLPLSPPPQGGRGTEVLNPHKVTILSTVLGLIGPCFGDPTLIIGQFAHDKHIIISAERIVAPDPESVARTGLSLQVVFQIREVVKDPPFRRTTPIIESMLHDEQPLVEGVAQGCQAARCEDVPAVRRPSIVGIHERHDSPQLGRKGTALGHGLLDEIRRNTFDNPVAFGRGLNDRTIRQPRRIDGKEPSPEGKNRFLSRTQGPGV